jgi:hypothetical protein
MLNGWLCTVFDPLSSAGIAHMGSIIVRMSTHGNVSFCEGFRMPAPLTEGARHSGGRRTKPFTEAEVEAATTRAVEFC